MRGHEYWIDKFLSRERFAMPLLNASMFALLMSTMELFTKIFPGYSSIVARWFGTVLLFIVAFRLYVHWEDYEETAKDKAKKAKDKASK